MAKKNDRERVAKIAQSIGDKTATIHEERERKKQRLSQGRPPRYKSARAMACKLALYMQECDDTIMDEERGRTKPYTLTGLQIAAGVSDETFRRYAQGINDDALIDVIKQTTDGQLIEDESQIYKAERELISQCYKRDDLRGYLDFLYLPDARVFSDISFSGVIKRARLLVQQQAEQRLYTRGSVADIFTLKARYGWQEQNTTVHRFEIATSEEAKKALEELHLLE